MIGAWEPPRIERVASREVRRLVALPTIGLSGDLHQDLGRSAMVVEIAGSLSTDEARDELLASLREQFLAGEPVDFVADIVKESELERVLIDELILEEVAGVADSFRYRIVLREYTEPPEPPAPALDELGLDLDALADLGLDMLDLPALLGEVPDIGDLLAPVQTAAADLRDTLGGIGEVFGPLTDFLKGPTP
jgi:hypothetical protein